MTQPLFLVGARGCGKTTVGGELAQALDYCFTDTDHWLQQNTGMSVTQIVEHEGWAGFRRRESLALQAVTAPGWVVATGGGMVLAEENRRYMREHGVVIYLEAPAAELARRLDAFPEKGQRPTLTGRAISEEVAEVLAAREALYREAAHHVVDASLSPPQVVAQILRALRLANAS
ncbi:shikimate kinase AroL [Erwinia sp. CPCC 100877]|nr:shikimate kinase AroL [Erwinia sp. CPCC 100877]